MKSTTIVLASLATANGFLFDGFVQSRPGLTKIVDAQPEQTLSVTLDIGNDDSPSRLVVNDLILGLHNAPPDYEHVAMPGKNGPHPKLSSGIRKLDTVQQGQFISMLGTEVVQTLKGCWEMIWRKDAPAGAVICGFDLPKEYVRNEARLPKGRVYLSFPVWTKETLADAQVRKANVLTKAAAFLQERDECLAKSAAETNPIMKALHYRNAYAAIEKYWMYPVEKMKMVPDPEEVITMQDDLLLTTKGVVWSKQLPNGDNIMLGTANLAPVLPN